MGANKKIQEILKKRILILDGATGTELQKRGMPAGTCPEAWCLKNPEIIRQVHSNYITSGSDVIYTPTFGANGFKLAKFKLQKKVFEINRRLAVLARKAAGKKALVAGDIGPTGRFVEPWGNLSFEEMVSVFKEQAKGLVAGGVDLFVIETMIDIQEARAALLAVKEITDKFVMVTMTFDKNCRTLNGTDPLTALVTLQSLGADAVGCNCSSGPRDMLRFIKIMKPYATVPLVAKPNAGIPELINAKTVFDMSPSEFAFSCQGLISAGVNILGGCCGTNPEYIRELRKKVINKKPILPFKKSLSALSSARKTVLLEKNHPLVIAGERINPTGKKLLQKELLEGKFALVRQMAKEQENAGADILDVNLGVAGIDEEKTMKQAINILSTLTELPLVIDSSDSKVVEAAIRLYPGRALINSISGEKEKIKNLLPIAAKYGAMFILLPIARKEIPETFKKRRQIIEDIFNKAGDFGFTKDDIVVDGLALSVSSHPDSARETLKTIQWCAESFKVNTIIGLSNISFGMPNRKVLNATYLSMAAARGLSMAIADPLDERLMDIKKTSDVLATKDKDITEFMNYCSEAVKIEKNDIKEKTTVSVSFSELISQAILGGDREGIVGYLDKAISSGQDPSGLISEVMTPAIIKVGELFDKRQYFLPQLIASAETMKIAVHHLEPYLKKKGIKEENKGIIVIATVKGDVHDIGKNIVSLLLRNHGFQVIDLGKDVPAKKVIKAIKEYKPFIAGLSALMTTTMVGMKEIIKLARQEHLKCDFLVGGAVLNETYARSIGATYAQDAVKAVRIAESLRR